MERQELLKEIKPVWVEGRGVYIPIIGKVLGKEELAPDGMTWKEALAAAKRVKGTIPTKDEWYIILYFRDEINALMKEHGARELHGYYWSSSEGSQTFAWNVLFSSGFVYGGDKYSTFYVRAVSAF
jgi:hypothetical protein